jgi:hypothetical protein
MNHRLLSARCLVVRAWAYMHFSISLRDIKRLMSFSLSPANCCLSPLIYKFKAVHTEYADCIIYPPHTHTLAFLLNPLVCCAVIFSPRWHFISNARCFCHCEAARRRTYMSGNHAVLENVLSRVFLFCASKPLEQNY